MNDPYQISTVGQVAKFCDLEFTLMDLDKMIDSTGIERRGTPLDAVPNCSGNAASIQ